ncbi:hypothetical protein AB3N04_13040 [Alkalihalophilus sp. As8PL]|uniref:Uncharacterized protein n=1 Tax=Alkalihalophilus sp. As8PL TaxID=3237103 RepID=A0AB39BP91_9BACI
MTTLMKDELELQTKKVLKLALQKKSIHVHGYLDTLIKKLEGLLKDLKVKVLQVIKDKSPVKGALRAYLETNLVESYQEPLVIELDALETMLS